jgi:hypothetical protein
MKYSINANNFIRYEIINDIVMIKWLFYDDVNLLSSSIFNYIDYLSTINNVEFLGWYPGTFNPLVVKYVLDYAKNKNFNYRIFYDLNEVFSVKAFEKTILQYNVEASLNIPGETVFQSSCDGPVGKISQQNGFKKCCVFTSLRQNNNIVKTPIKYYEIDDQGFLVQEHSEKPKNNKKYYQSFRIENLFRSMKIKIENGKLVYYQK